MTLIMNNWRERNLKGSVVPYAKGLTCQSLNAIKGDEFFMRFCTVHRKTIIRVQYEPTKCTFSTLIFHFFYVFYMFRARGFVFRKTVVCTATVQYVLHVVLYLPTLYLQHCLYRCM